MPPVVGRAGDQFAPEEQTNCRLFAAESFFLPYSRTVAGSGERWAGQSVAGNCPAFSRAWRMS